MRFIDTQDLNKFSIKAIDGEIGTVTDFYFDEDFFNLRYLVVNTESFLLRKLVLVSPICIDDINVKAEYINSYLSKKELENSPPIDAAKTVSRQYEKLYNEYFSWPQYWGLGSSAWSIGPYGIPNEFFEDLGGKPRKVKNGGVKNREVKSRRVEEVESCTLRSAKEVCSYAVEGSDKEFGHIQGFILNLDTLAIDYFVIDTLNFLPSKLVLLRPEWVKEISWRKKTVKFPFDKKLIKTAPTYKKNNFKQDLLDKTEEHFREFLSGNPEVKVLNTEGDSKPKFKVANKKLELSSVTEEEKVVGHIPSGLFIVTVEDPDSHKTQGFLASWVQQASFSPLLISICIKDGRPGIDHVLKKLPFCINIVGKGKTDFLNHFMSSDSANALENVAYKNLKNKGAIIDQAKSALICKAQEIYHPGDHYLITAEVTEGIILDDKIKSKTYLRNEGSHY